MPRYVLAALISLLLVSGAAATDPLEFAEEFEQANKFYEDRDYVSAIRLYSSIVDQGYESAELHFNLGNAYFKNGDLGWAVYSYLKARRLDPSDEDIATNLEFAKRYSRVQMEGVKLNPVSAALAGLVEGYRLELLGWVSSALFLLTLTLLALRFGFGFAGAAVRAGLVAAVTLALIAGGLTTFKYRTEFLKRQGVIVAAEAPVYTGPSEASDIELHGAPGLVVEIVSESSGFYEVLFENKRKGFVSADLLAEI